MDGQTAGQLADHGERRGGSVLLRMLAEHTLADAVVEPAPGAGKPATVGASKMEPEVGLEPTTYRLQDNSSALTAAATSNDSRGPGLS